MSYEHYNRMSTRNDKHYTEVGVYCNYAQCGPNVSQSTDNY